MLPLRSFVHVKPNSNILLRMDRTEHQNECEHIIDIRSTRAPSTASSSREGLQNGSDLLQTEAQPSASARHPMVQPSVSTANRSNSRNSSLDGRGNGHGRRRSPLNSGLWISVELVITVSQIVASIVILSLSKDENPHAPLLEWIVGYASGCLAILPLLYWRYRHRNQASEQDSSQPRQSSAESSLTARTNSYGLPSISGTVENDQQTVATSGSVQRGQILNAR